MGNRVEGKVVLVAGAGSVAPGWSNGRAASVLYAREGAKVFAADIRLETAQETKDIIDGEGGECTTFQVDVINAGARVCGGGLPAKGLRLFDRGFGAF